MAGHRLALGLALALERLGPVLELGLEQEEQMAMGRWQQEA